MQSDDKAKALTVRIPSRLWKSVKIKCVQEDTNIQTVLADFLSSWVAANGNLDNLRRLQVRGEATEKA
ncbi:MAG: hypothetical protein FJ317_09185 [SAR202 cluster bacterium]|nr:hypothetical protein [SAR202 cluster bacterium]